MTAANRSPAAGRAGARRSHAAAARTVRPRRRARPPARETRIRDSLAAVPVAASRLRSVIRSGERATSSVAPPPPGPVRENWHPHPHRPHSTGDGTSVVFLLFETLSFLSTFGAAEAAAVMAQPPTSEGASAPPTSRALAAVAWSQLWPRLAGQCCCSGVDTSAQDFEYH